jgi:serine/threonine protein kinase
MIFITFQGADGFVNLIAKAVRYSNFGPAMNSEHDEPSANSAAGSLDDFATLRVAPPTPAEMLASPPAHASVMDANPDSPVPFVFGRRIAKGGMGAILEGDDCKLGRKIAVKIMLDASASAEQTQRFVQEAAVLGRLEHPNIVPIHDLGRDSEGALYYTMKLVKGVTLQHILDDLRHEKKDALEHYTLDRLLTIFRKVCDALAFAHANQIIHRDLKPENIMVGEFGEVLVMDWGIAKILDGSADTPVCSDPDPISGQELRSREANPRSLTATMDGAVMGTPNYMSPEQAMGKVNEFDERSDIFSLGGILYAILTLRPPVEGKDVWEVLEKVSTADITAPTTFGTTTGKGKPQSKAEVLEARLIKPLPHLKGGRVPAALSAVAMKALSLDKAERYQHVAALSEDLEAYQSGFATSAEQAGAWTQLQLFIKRHRSATVGAALVLLVGSTLGTKALLEGRRAEKMLLKAEQTLDELRGTAPVFESQSRSSLAAGDLDEALARIGYASKLAPENADYRLARAHLLQSTKRLAEAADEYRQVLARRASDHSARINLEVCEGLITEARGAEKLPLALLNKLLDALIAQHRDLEAAPLSKLLHRDGETLKATVLAKLSFYRDQKGWNDSRLGYFNGGINLTLTDLIPGDLSALKGLPINRLTLGNSNLTDLRPLAGMPLDWLTISYTKVSDLSPLKGMKLRVLKMRGLGVKDLSPLNGMPLEDLDLEDCRQIDNIAALHGMPLRFLNLNMCFKLQDISPLRGMSLESLIISSTHVADISVLKGMPLRSLTMRASYISDCSPIEGCQTLMEIGLPHVVLDYRFLLTLPKLQKISSALGSRYFSFEPAKEFIARHDPESPEIIAARKALADARIGAVVGAERFEVDSDRKLKLHLFNLGIRDLSRLRGLPIKYLDLSMSFGLSDLEPLRGMPLKFLNLERTECFDVAPLAECPELEELVLAGRPTAVGMPVTYPKNLELLRTHPKLRYLSQGLNPATQRPAQTVEEFWREYDAKQAAGVK